MCPVLGLSVLCSMLVLCIELVSCFSVTYVPSEVSLPEGSQQLVKFQIMPDESPEDLPPAVRFLEYQVDVADSNIAEIKGDRKFIFRRDQIMHRNMSNAFLIEATFMGLTSVVVSEAGNGSKSASADDLSVIVTRKQSTISTIFTYSVAILVSLNYINMGCALDMKIVASVLRSPVAPAVGVICQYVIMPVSAYFLGLWLLADATHLRLGLFIFGCSPAGGASNMWTVLLAGNLDLSITMTFISTLLASGTALHQHCCRCR